MSNVDHVRDLEPRDAAALQAMLAAAHLPPAEIGRAGARFIKLCDANGETVGFAGLEPYGQDALLRSVVVTPGRRGHGAGRRLVEASLARAPELGAARVYLLTTTARDFFAHLGFQPVARDQVPEAVAQSTEFTSLCPASAICMRKDIRPRA